MKRLAMIASTGSAEEGAVTVSGTTLSGRVRFPERYTTATTLRDVAVAATVSLIDTVSNQTVATSLTDAQGRFNLVFASNFAPSPNIYILEAIKGLSSNKPGSPAVRVRTFIRFINPNWTSMSAGGLVVNRSTTALCVIAGLRGLAPVNFIEKVIPGNPDIFLDGGTGVSQADYSMVLSLVIEALTNDRDPVDSILWNPIKGYYLKDGTGASNVLVAIFEMYPQPASAGGQLTIVGANIGEAGLNNLVKFNNEATGSLLATGSNSVTVRIPEAAKAGLLTLINPFGTATADVAIVAAFAGDFGPNGALNTLPPGATPQPNLIGDFNPGPTPAP